MSSASQTSSRSMSVLLLLAVAALAMWNGWLTWENIRMKKAMGTDGGSDLAAKVQSIEETMENGLVLSLLDPAREQVVFSNPLKPIMAKAAPPPLEPGPEDLIAEDPEEITEPIELNAPPPSDKPSDDDVKAPFDFTTGGVSPKAPPPPAEPDLLIGPQLPELPPNHSVPEDVANVRDPAPSSGTFGESRPVIGGGGGRNILDLTITEVFSHNIVALDGGAKNGVQVGTSFSIIRDGNEIGKIQIQEVSDSHSAAEILEYTGGFTIRTGDRVTPIRK